MNLIEFDTKLYEWIGKHRFLYLLIVFALAFGISFGGFSFLGTPTATKVMFGGGMGMLCIFIDLTAWGWD